MPTGLGRLGAVLVAAVLMTLPHSPALSSAAAGTTSATDARQAVRQDGHGGGRLSGATGLAAGRGHSCAVVPGGRVRCWGANDLGQLGDGTTTRRLTATEIGGLSGVVAVRAGGDHTCVLTYGGEVRCWGANGSGQLGDGTTAHRSRPVVVTGLPRAVAIAAGQTHACAVVADGGAYCWGGNARGQLGDGTTTDRPVPVAVTGLTGLRDIQAGDALHTCALAGDGKVRCWGRNQLGELGDGVQNEPYDPGRMSAVPVTVAGLGEVRAISVAGAANSCALLGDGTVRCWGWNAFGQLGIGGVPSGSPLSRLHSATPVTVGELPPVTALSQASGTGHMCAVTGGGLPRCWGHNGLGQVGDGGLAHRSTPMAVTGLKDATAVTGGASHTCAITRGGYVSCWGFNNKGQLGDGTTTNRPEPVEVLLEPDRHATRPVTVKGLGGARAVTAGGDHTCAVMADTTVRCWGANHLGQLGTGTPGGSSPPVTVQGLSGVTAITAGQDHTCAIVAAGQVRCWGWNGLGQLGDGTYTDRAAATAVDGLTGAVAIAAGGNHTCVIVTGGEVRCWGHNYVGGALGVQPGSAGGQIAHPAPVAVPGLTGATAVGAGRAHTCVTVAGGEVRCWGWGAEGQLGNGGVPIAGPAPVPAQGISGATGLATGGDHTCVTLSGGQARCWGFNHFGQLGDDTTTTRKVPAEVVGLSAATAVAAGRDHTCALAGQHGAVRCWGWNAHGQLGDGTRADRALPVEVEGLGGATAVAAGRSHTCAVTTGGGVRCWGLDDRGQLGIPPA